MMRHFLDICDDIGVPISMEKTEFAVTVIIFLGILLDGQLHVLAVPEQKRLKALSYLQEIIDKRSATVRQLQSLAGLLNFLNHAIFPGRAFTHRMYAKFSGMVNKKLGQTELQQHHQVRLDKEFKDDCRMWCSFLNVPHAQGICCPFIDLEQTVQATELDFYTDSTEGINLGMGGVFGSHWFFAKWEVGYICNCDPSIAYLELLAICTDVFIWSKELKNTRVVVFSDNQSAVSMINDTTSKCKKCMHLIRQLTLRSLKNNMRIFAKWICGSSNIRADLLSHQKIQEFKETTT